MALLTSVDRIRTGAQWMRENLLPVAFSKSDLQAAIITTDQWAEDNAASFNSSLPVNFRTLATLFQKTMLLAFVLWRRAGRLSTQEDSN